MCQDSAILQRFSTACLEAQLFWMFLNCGRIAANIIAIIAREMIISNIVNPLNVNLNLYKQSDMILHSCTFFEHIC